ncbi:MAG: hypothetical protein AAB550_03840 [Patescibacteria group bacterium]
MQINLNKLDYKFLTKPLLVGGMAMEFYNLRKSGEDIDLIVTTEDYLGLAKRYPNYKRDLGSDLGVTIYDFEIWKCIRGFHYEFLSQGAIENEEVRIIHLNKLLFMKTLAIAIEKYEKDVRLIVQKISDIQYENDKDYKPEFLLQ